ncbi:MAG: hypothetical protein MJ072_04080, partial [Clostridia bacterium]|nr:hypothetical protein [Clostridia bacterium]
DGYLNALFYIFGETATANDLSTHLFVEVENFRNEFSEKYGYVVERLTSSLNHADAFKAKTRAIADKAPLHYLKARENLFNGLPSDARALLANRIENGLHFAYSLTPLL